MSIYSNDYQTTLGDISNPLRLSGIYGSSANNSLYSADPTEPGLFNLLGALVTKGTDSMKDNLRTSLKDRAITPYANDLTKLTAMKDKTGDYQFLKNNMVSNLSGLEDWLLDARRDKGINNAIDTVNTSEGASWLNNYKASVSGMPVNDVLHGAKNLDSLYDLAGKGRTGGEMLNVKESANKAVQNQLIDWLKPEIQSAVDDAALRGEILTPAAIINSSSPIISNMLTQLGVDPRIANNRQIIDPVRESLFTQYNAAVGPNGALKPEDARAWETKRDAANQMNKLIMNAPGFDAASALGPVTDAVAKNMGFDSKAEAIKSGIYFMEQRFKLKPDVMNFREKLQNGDKNYIFSPEFKRVLTEAESFDRANSALSQRSMVTELTGQPNYIEHLNTLAKVLQPKSKEDQQKKEYLMDAVDFYNKVQGSGTFNPIRNAYLNKVTDAGLTDMKTTVKSLAQTNNVTLNDTQLNNTVEYFIKVLNDEKVPYMNLDKPAYNKSDNTQWPRINLKMEAYLLGIATNMVTKSE